MSRNPRGTCPGALTRTELLRQAKTAALVKDIAQKEEAAARQRVEQYRPHRKIARQEPKKVDFSKPGMTKTMMARMKQAEAFKQEYERKQAALRAARIPKKTPAPIGGDARLGRERSVVTGRHTPAVSPQVRKSLPMRRLRSPQQILSKKTAELAIVMKADVIQAEPIGEGPISNIVIPPGVVNEERTTIVNIVPAAPDTETSQVASRSIKVISETLDEQDAVESTAVQNKLADLQQARRDFVIAVANVGGNAVHIDDEKPPSVLEDSLEAAPPPRSLFRVPDVADKYLKPSYGYDHPHLIAARAHMEKVKAEVEAREAARRTEEEFERIAAAEQLADNLHLDIPFEEELFSERDISWDEDENGMAMPHPSRIKAHLSPVPKQQQPYQHEPFDPEMLDKFFNVERFPPCTHCGPPPGREQLHPDLWDLEDPWYKLPTCDAPDLITFD